MAVAGTNLLWKDGTIDVGTLKIGGTASTATAAELNYLDITTLGTGAASKAVVLDAGDDYIWPATGQLTYGGTAVTANGAEMNYLDITTLGTGAASKAVVLDAGDDYTWPAAGVLTYGVLNDGTTALGASALELNAVCDTSARLVAGGATLTITQALHDGRTILWDTAAGTILTLPAATGTGMKIRCVVSVTATTNSHIVKAANATDHMYGTLMSVDTDTADATLAWAAELGDTMDTITFNRTTTGLAAIGDWVELQDVASAAWAVTGSFVASGTVATPFSSAIS